MGSPTTAAAASTTVQSGEALMRHQILARVIVVCGVAFTVVWTCVLAYGLFRLVELVI